MRGEGDLNRKTQNGIAQRKSPHGMWPLLLCHGHFPCWPRRRGSDPGMSFNVYYVQGIVSATDGLLAPPQLLLPWSDLAGGPWGCPCVPSQPRTCWCNPQGDGRQTFLLASGPNRGYWNPCHWNLTSSFCFSGLPQTTYLNTHIFSLKGQDDLKEQHWELLLLISLCHTKMSTKRYYRTREIRGPTRMLPSPDLSFSHLYYSPIIPPSIHPTLFPQELHHSPHSLLMSCKFSILQVWTLKELSLKS